MLKEERQGTILETLHRDRKVVAATLSERLAVSEDTIRRDLRELAEQGLLQRVHGGALPCSPAAASYAERTRLAPDGKAAVALAALRLVRDGQVILLDGGTTAVQVAQRLPRPLRATVVTSSPPVAMALAEHPSVEVVLLGGRLFKSSLVAVGAATVETLHGIRADLCLLGICSLHPDVGISVPDYEEAQVKRAMMRSSAEVAALATSEKLDTAAPYVVGPLQELTHLITEASVAEEVLAPYRACGLTILQAERE